MYTNYTIPQNRYNNVKNHQNNYSTYPNTIYYGNDDRFFGGALAPFLLGGIGGYLIGRPNYPQGPIPVYFPPQPAPYYVPYSSNTNIYY